MDYFFLGSQEERADENPMLVILAPFKKKHRRYKAVILLEAALFACCTVLNRSAMTKLVSSTSVSALFAAFSIYARPYIEPIENWTDIAGRVFMLITLGAGIALEKEPGEARRHACNVILGAALPAFAVSLLSLSWVSSSAFAWAFAAF